MIIFEVGSNASSSVIVQCPLTLNAWLDSTKPLFALLLEMHTMPELMTISALALSWLSAMMLPFEKYFVSLRSKSCNKNGWNHAWTRMMKGVNSNELTKQRLKATFHSIDISKMFQLYINLILWLSARDLHPSTVTKTSWVSHWELGDRLAHTSAANCVRISPITSMPTRKEICRYRVIVTVPFSCAVSIECGIFVEGFSLKSNIHYLGFANTFSSPRWKLSINFSCAWVFLKCIRCIKPWRTGGSRSCVRLQASGRPTKIAGARLDAVHSTRIRTHRTTMQEREHQARNSNAQGQYGVKMYFGFLKSSSPSKSLQETFQAAIPITNFILYVDLMMLLVDVKLKALPVTDRKHDIGPQPVIKHVMTGVSLVSLCFRTHTVKQYFKLKANDGSIYRILKYRGNVIQTTTNNS